MANKGRSFEVSTHRVNANGEGALIIRLKLGEGLSQEALRHIELEAKDAVLEVLSPLKGTIDRIVAKDRKANHSSNPDEDVCEACQ